MAASIDRAVLYFGNDWDAENRTSSHQIALQLRNWVELIYVECPGLRAPAAKARDLHKLIDKLAKAFRGPRVDTGMPIYTLLQVPFHGMPLVGWLNKWLVKYQVAKIRRRLRHRLPPLLWFTVPHIAYLPKMFSDCPSVYYCVDKYAALPGVDVAAVRAMDEMLTKSADLVFVASETLLQDKRPLRPDCILSPHGVDFELFGNTGSVDLERRPSDLPPWPGPVIGFFGLLESWIDLDLLVHMAGRRPDWLIVLIGHAAVDVGKLRQFPNVVLTGVKSFQELPRYGRRFDVCMLPYRLTDQVINSNPIKLREYLAMGKPVVSVRFPHASQFAALIYLAESPDDFILQTELALREDSDELRARRIESVRATTWRARAQSALQRVDDYVSRQPAAPLAASSGWRAGRVG